MEASYRSWELMKVYKLITIRSTKELMRSSYLRVEVCDINYSLWLKEELLELDLITITICGWNC